MGKRRKRLTEDMLPKVSIYETNAHYFARLIDQFSKKKLESSAISFEALVALYAGDESENDRAELIRHLPVKEWRTDTVPVPRELLRPLVEGWLKYRENIAAGDITPLGKALGIEGSGQGKEGAAKVLERVNRDIGLANRVTELEITEPDTSFDDIFDKVAGEAGLSAETVRNAYRENRPRRDANIARLRKG